MIPLSPLSESWKNTFSDEKAKIHEWKICGADSAPASSGSAKKKVISIISDDVFASSFSLRVNEHPMQHCDLHFNWVGGAFFFARIMISKVIFYAFIRRYRVNAAFKNAIKKVRSSYLWFQNCAEILRFLSSMTRRVHVSINQKFKINNLLVLITYILYIEFRKNEHWMRRKMKMQQFSLLVIG